MTVTGSAASPPDSNTLVKENVVKGWAHITYSAGTPTLADSYNVSGIVDTAVGRIAIQWNTDFANATYSVSGATQSDTASETITVGILDSASGGAITAGDADIVMQDSATTDKDPEYVMVQAIGDQ